MTAYVEKAISGFREGSMSAFSIVDKYDNKMNVSGDFEGIIRAERLGSDVGGYCQIFDNGK
jgi:hypothetical protein